MPNHRMKWTKGAPYFRSMVSLVSAPLATYPFVRSTPPSDCMIDSSEMLPVLLDVRREGDGLVLRIDTDPCSTGSAEAAVVVLSMVGCAESEEASTALEQAVGQAVEYGTSVPDESGARLWFSIDYGRVYEEVECIRYTESEEAASIGDLLKRSRFLFSWLREWQERHEDTYRQHADLRARLEVEIAQESDRCRRKLEFFSETNAAMAGEMRARLAVYERMHKLWEQ